MAREVEHLRAESDVSEAFGLTPSALGYPRDDVDDARIGTVACRSNVLECRACPRVKRRVFGNLLGQVDELVPAAVVQEQKEVHVCELALVAETARRRER